MVIEIETNSMKNMCYMDAPHSPIRFKDNQIQIVKYAITADNKKQRPCREILQGVCYFTWI